MCVNFIYLKIFNDTKCTSKILKKYFIKYLTDYNHFLRHVAVNSKG